MIGDNSGPCKYASFVRHFSEEKAHVHVEARLSVCVVQQAAEKLTSVPRRSWKTNQQNPGMAVAIAYDN